MPLNYVYFVYYVVLLFSYWQYYSKIYALQFNRSKY